jgi:hypothetical protein
MLRRNHKVPLAIKVRALMALNAMSSRHGAKHTFSGIRIQSGQEAEKRALAAGAKAQTLLVETPIGGHYVGLKPFLSLC